MSLSSATIAIFNKQEKHFLCVSRYSYAWNVEEISRKSISEDVRALWVNAGALFWVLCFQGGGALMEFLSQKAFLDFGIARLLREGKSYFWPAEK